MLLINQIIFNNSEVSHMINCTKCTHSSSTILMATKSKLTITSCVCLNHKIVKFLSKHQHFNRGNKPTSNSRTVWLKWDRTANHHLFSLQITIKYSKAISFLIKEVLSLHQDSQVNSNLDNNWTICHSQMARTANPPLNSSSLSLNTRHHTVLTKILSKWEGTSQCFRNSHIKCHLRLSRPARIRTSRSKDRQALVWELVINRTTFNSTTWASRSHSDSMNYPRFHRYK